ncbi:MAG: hypothetical protein MR793_04155 [Bacteroidales bacterium]|nr:hypothetical protein [Bacteroidales bacterium]
MSCSIIDGIFAACCGTMYGMADMFGRTYEYVNVLLFCYVEPVLTVLMILGAMYALFRLPKARHVAKAFMWLGIVVSVLTGVLLIVSAIHAWGMVDMLNITQEEINAVQTSIMTPDPDPVIHDLFQKTMHWLMDTSKGNVGYNAINLLIYVLLMPVLIITSICVCYKASKK